VIVDMTLNLAELSPREREIFFTGYGWGHVAGIDRGRQLIEDEIAALQRAAYRKVRAASTLLPWDEHAANVRRRRLEACERNKAGREAT